LPLCAHALEAEMTVKINALIKSFIMSLLGLAAQVD